MVRDQAVRRAGKLRLRSALLLSTAVSIAAVGQAHAQASYQDNGPGDVVYEAATVSGAPEAVYLSSPDGSVTAMIGTVTATGQDGNFGNVIEAQAAGDHGLNVSVDTMLVTGPGQAAGVYTWSGTGLSTVEVGSLDLFGRAGIFAQGAGDVAITAGTVRVNGSTDGNFDLYGIAAGKAVTLEDNDEEVRHRVGGDLTITAESVEVRGSADAFAINADVIGNATITAGAIRSDGEGVDIYSEQGDVSIALNGDVEVAEGAVSADAAGLASVTIAEGVTVSAGGGAVEAEGAGSVRITNNGTVINTGANGESGQAAILGEAEGDVTIVSNIATSNSDVLPGDSESATVQAISQTGAVNITTGLTTTNGGSMYGVWGYSDSGTVTIDAGTTISTASAMTGDYTAEAVVGSSRTGDVFITSDYAEAAGQYASAVLGSSGANAGGQPIGGNVTIVSGVARSTNANSGATVFGYSVGGDVSITTTGDTLSVSDGAVAGRGRDVTLTSTGGATVTGGRNGYFAIAGRDAVVNTAATIVVPGVTATNASLNGITVEAGRNIDITSADVTVSSQAAATTQQNSAGIRAISSGGGNVTIASGAIDVSGDSRSGIRAVTTGDVTITASGDTVASAGTGMLVNGRNVSITTAADSVTRSGANANGSGNAINVTASGDSVVVNDGTATGNAATPTIAVTAVGKSTITSNITENTGSGAAIFTSAGNGVAIEASTVRAGSTSSDIVRGIATSAGDTTIDVGTLTGASGFSGIYGQANNGAVRITADSVVNSSAAAPNGNGAISAGITGVGRNGVTIVAGDVDANGWAIRAATNAGNPANNPVIPLNDSHVSITTTGNVTSRSFNAISITGNVASFDLTIAETSTVTGNGGSATVAGGARLGDINVVNNGRVIAQGSAEGAIGVTATGGGNVMVASNAIRVDGSAPVTSGFTAAGISAVSQGGNGNVNVSSATIEVGGAQRYGIFTRAAGTGTIAIQSGDLSVNGADVAGIYAQSGSGAITIASESLVNAGTSAMGIEARSWDGGDISITSGTLVNSATGSSGTTDANGDPRIAEGIYANTVGAISVKSASVDVSGFGASGIAALAGDTVNVESGSIVTRGDQTTALYVGTWAGDVTADSGSITMLGADASGIGVSTDDGAAFVTSGSIASEGRNSYGISAYGTRGATVTSTDIAVGRFGVFAQSTAGDVSVSLLGDTITGTDFDTGTSYAVRALGGKVAVTSAAGTTSSGANFGFDVNARETATIVNQGTVSATGPNAIGIKAVATAGIDIQSNAVTVGGIAADPGVDPGTGFRAARGGIIAEGGAGPVSIDSGSATVAGDYRFGIYARSTGAIDIASEALRYEAADSAGIMVLGGDGDVTVASGTLDGSGVSGAGIVVRTGAGDIDIAADRTTLTGEGISGDYTADALAGISQSGAVTITSNNASTAGFGGSALFGMGTTVTLDSKTASATGDGGAILFAIATNGDATVNSDTVTTAGADSQAIVARASGTVRIASGTIVASGANASGIDALGTAGNVVHTGNIVADGYALRAESAGDTAITLEGAVTSANAWGVRAAGRQVTVMINADASVSGASGALVTANTGSGTGIVNLGTIAGGVSTSGATHLDNAGVINAAPGFAAVTMDASDDRVTLRTGSLVNGVIDMGGGVDSVALAGAEGGTLAQFANAETLSVEAGRWSTGATANAFDHVTIAGGAELQVNLDADGESGIDTGSILTDGTLTLNYTDTSQTGEIGGVAVSGAGKVRLIGAGELELTSDMVVHTGGTAIENGQLTLTGALRGDVVTSGNGVFQLGDGGTQGSFTGNLINNGTFIYDRLDGYTIAGDFTGTGTFLKRGDGVLTFGGLYDFTGTTLISAGSVRFTGQLDEESQIDLQSGTLDLSQIEGGQQTIGELSGASGGAIELGSSQLTINQGSSTTFAGSISGEGGLVKEGSGTLNLTGTSDYSGNTQVRGGTLKVNGALPNSTVVVEGGGTLGGNGTIGGLSMSGGTLAPGNSIGRLTVNGPVVFTAASIYAVEVNAAGAADRIDATGTATLGGATLQVLAEPGRYRGLTSYTILTAVGGVSGTFGTVTSNFAFLTPTVSYGANSVTLNLRRNDASFASFGSTPNARAVGAALQGLGGGNALYEEALVLQDTLVSPDFESLSGELHAGVASGMIENAQALRRTLLTRTAPAEAGGYGWATLIGNWGTANATAGNRALETEQQGVMGGIGYAAGGFNASLGLGKLTAEFVSSGKADADSTAVVGTIGYASGAFEATIGGSYAWHSIDTNRRTNLGALSDSLRDETDGTTSQIFGEVAFDLTQGPIAVTPFAGLAWIETHRDAITESGGATALDIAADTRQVTFANLGVRMRGNAQSADGGLSLSPYASASWRRAWGDREAPLAAGFAGSGGSFAIVGPVIARDAAELGLGLELGSGNVRVSAGYNGAISGDWSNHSAQLKLSIGF